MSQRKTKMAADKILMVLGPPNSAPTFADLLLMKRIKTAIRDSMQNTVTENPRLPTGTLNACPWDAQ
jgi:hypothetical protein